MLSLIKDINKKKYANIKLIVSNNCNSLGLMEAKKLGLNTHVLTDQDDSTQQGIHFEENLCKLLIESKIHLICMAGFMRILTKKFVDSWENRILNIHPSILPNYKGLNTHQRVIEAGDKVHGCSVHYVNGKVDDGKVLGQALVEVATSDTPDTLAKKVLKEEHNLYPKVLFSVIKKNELFLIRKKY
jgi:phosphoribosylglycinamide formyltransferase-1